MVASNTALGETRGGQERTVTDYIDDELDEELEQLQANTRPRATLDGRTLRAPVTVLDGPEPICVRAHDSVRKAIDLMKGNRIGAVMVVDGEGKLSGIFTERDVVHRLLDRGLDWQALSVGEVMTRKPESLQPDAMIAYALNFMHVGGFRHVPIVDTAGRPVTIVSIKDVVAYLADFFPEEISNLPPDPSHAGPTERYGG